MKIKKNIRNWRSVLALTLVVFMGLTSVVEAYSVTTSGTNTISPTSANFKSAKSPMYINKTQTINESISTAYEMDIYHYECQEGGYYQVYTTKALDTVGAVYEEENSLFSSPTYERRAFNDVGKITSADNFSMVIDMDKWEDYYVCVRGYNKNTGSYTLNIEPNQDKVFNTKYGVWKCKYTPASAAMSGVWTNRKVYLTKEQALACYLALEGWEFSYNGSAYAISELKKLYTGNPNLVINILMTTVSSVLGVYNTAAGITVSIAGLILSETLGASGSLKVDLASKLEQVCGITKKTTSAITGNGVKGSISILNGVMMKETYTGVLGNLYVYDFSKYSGVASSILTGEKWYYGQWTH